MAVFLQALCGFLSILFICVLPAQAGTFVDNKDGIVFDTQTSLMWQKMDDGTERVWTEAERYCDELELGGFSDWELPKIFMLEGLIVPGQSPTIDPVFSVKPSYYWSSSESRSSATSAKYVNFYYGNTYTYSKDNTYYALCVRDASADKAASLAANFTFSKEKEPFSVQFLAEISGGSEPFFYEWDFGDGDTSSRSEPVHVFPGDGMYNITLTVTDNGGSNAFLSQEMVLPLPELIVEPVAPEKPTADPLPPGVVDGDSNVDTGEIIDGNGSGVSGESNPLGNDALEANGMAHGETDSASEAIVDLDGSSLAVIAGAAQAVGLASSGQEAAAVVVGESAEILPSISTGEDTPGAIVSEDLNETPSLEESDLAIFDAASAKVQEVVEDPESGSEILPESKVDGVQASEAVAVTLPLEVDTSLIAEREYASGQGNAEVLVPDIEDSALTPSPGEEVGSKPENGDDAEVLPEVAVIVEPEQKQVTLETTEESGAEHPVESGAEQPMELSIGDTGAEAGVPTPPVFVGTRSVLQVFAGQGSGVSGSSALGHHLLAYSFANAVKGDADLNKDANIGAYELKGYLSIAMESLSQGKQKPEIFLSGDSFSLCSEKKDTYVLVIGADRFDQGKGSWALTTESAELVRKSIEGACLNVKTISLSSEHANRQAVLQALGQIKSLIGPDDTLVFYFSGKSILDPEGRLLLSLFDTVSDMSSLTGLYYSDILHYMHTMNTARVTLLLESAAPQSKM